MSQHAMMVGARAVSLRSLLTTESMSVMKSLCVLCVTSNGGRCARECVCVCAVEFGSGR